MATSSGVTSAHILGWFITALAFGGNLLWNLKNRQHANNLADQIRSDQYHKEIWDRHRNKIEERVEEFVSLVGNLPAQIIAMPTDNDAPLPLAHLGVTLNVSHDGLARALSAADASAYCKGGKWAEKAFGVYVGRESSWDLILAEFELASSERAKSDQVKHLTTMNAHALEIELAVREEIRQVEFLYQP